MVTQRYCVFDHNSRCWTNDTTKPNELIRGNPSFLYPLAEQRHKVESWPKAGSWLHHRWGWLNPALCCSILSAWPTSVWEVAVLETSCVLDTAFSIRAWDCSSGLRVVPPGCLLGMMGSIHFIKFWYLVEWDPIFYDESFRGFVRWTLH